MHSILVVARVHSGRVLSRDASLAQLQLCDADLLTLVVKPASSFVLFGTAGGCVELWDIDDCNIIRTLVGHSMHEVRRVDDFLNDYLIVTPWSCFVWSGC